MGLYSLSLWFDFVSLERGKGQHGGLKICAVQNSHGVWIPDDLITGPNLYLLKY